MPILRLLKQSSYIETKANLQVMLRLICCTSQPVITEYTLQSLISTLLLTSSMEH